MGLGDSGVNPAFVPAGLSAVRTSILVINDIHRQNIPCSGISGYMKMLG